MSAASIRYVEKNRGRISLSVLLIVSVLALTGVFFVTHNNIVDAAPITLASDTMNNSTPSSTAIATSTHLIAFTLPTALSASDTITITFPSAFATTSGLDFNDFDLTNAGSEETLGNHSETGIWGATTSGGIVITFTVDDGGVASGATMTVEIGDNATAGATGDSFITNPVKVLAAGIADIYTVSIGGTSDSGDMLIAIVEGVAVSVTIDESLAFTIASSTNDDCDTAFSSLPGPDSTASTVPFGTLTTPNAFTHACQNLTVSTNASSGYVVTAQIDRSLRSGSLLIANGNCDGTCDITATDTWTGTSNNGFAYSATGTDAILHDVDYRNFACTGVTTTDCLPRGGETAQNVMISTIAVSNSTATVEYKLNFSGTQEAGTYTNTVTYIVTPTF